jgi:DNA replication protein DnaC
MKRIDEILGQAFAGRTASGATGGHPVEEDPPPAGEEEACPCCGGAGFVRKRVPLGHPDFGRAFPCECTAHEQDEDRRRRLLHYSNLGPLTRLTFDNLSRRGRSSNVRDQEKFQRCADDAFAFAADPSGWLVLSGPSGCGKTHLAAAITNRCLELGHAALFVFVPDLLDQLRAAYHPESETGFDSTFELVRNAPVLCWTTGFSGTQVGRNSSDHQPPLQCPTAHPHHHNSLSSSNRLNTRLSDLA